MSEPIKLQVVFQGGGAKLVSLMAVCAMLQEMQKAKIIEVTRVAGSSAGAIAAVMLASGVEIDTYKALLRSVGKEHLKHANVRRARGMWNVATGSAWFPDLNLQTFFHELFNKDGKAHSLGDLQKICPALIYTTNLVSMRAQQLPPETPIAQALKSSCRFPLAFAGFKSEDMFVDGGLAMNLPVDQLKQDESTFGKVIGISFEEEYLPDPKGFREYVERLFSAAIQSGVARSEMMLRSENVFRVQTGISTFDFEKAIGDGLSSERFGGLKSRFETWLAAWIKRHGPVEPQPQPRVKKHGNQRLIRPSETDRPWGRAVMSELDYRLKTEKITDALSIELFDIGLIDGNGEFTGLYRSICRKKFRIVAKTNVLQFSCQIGPNGTFDSSNFGCSVTDCNDIMLNFTVHVEEATQPGEDMRRFNVYFLFNEPLHPDSPNQPYYLDYQYDGDDPYPKLGKEPEIVALTFNQGTSGEATIGLALPTSRFPAGKARAIWDLAKVPKDKLDPAAYPEERWAAFVEMSDILEKKELIRDFGGLPYDTESYVIIGRRAKKLLQYQTVGVVIE